MSIGTFLVSLGDNELLARLQRLRRCESETTLEILRHLNEVERRKLHLKLGYSSMFAYCTEHLRYSESAAGRRVQAARCLQRFPRVEPLLERGDVNLATLGLVASLLTDQTADQLLERIRGKSQREVEEIASAFRPPIRLRDRVQRVNVPAPAEPAPPAAPTPAKDSPTLPQQVMAPSPMLVNPGTNSRCGSEKPPSAVKTVSKLYIQFLADEAFIQDYNEACALLSCKIPKPSFAAVFGALLEDYLTRRRPRERQQRRERRVREMQAAAAARSGEASRDRPAIPARTRDAVFVRDKGRCTYVGTNGQRCGSTRGLHIDHMTPLARNGTNELKNLRLLCARHNQLEAERILGEGLMRSYREPGPSAPRQARQLYCFVSSFPFTIGTKRTAVMTCFVTLPPFFSTSSSSWKPVPTGTTIRPPSASWSTSACGSSGGAAVTTMASKGAFSGQPW
jgi:5-methylcytosine-specific restriction endonuclease McrA